MRRGVAGTVSNIVAITMVTALTLGAILAFSPTLQNVFVRPSFYVTHMLVYEGYEWPNSYVYAKDNIGNLFLVYSLGNYAVITNGSGAILTINELNESGAIINSSQIVVPAGTRLFKFYLPLGKVYLINSSAYVALYGIGTEDEYEGGYSLVGKDVVLLVPEDDETLVSITAFTDATMITIDFNNGTVATFTLSRGDMKILRPMHFEGEDGEDEDSAEVWRVTSSKPVSILVLADEPGRIHLASLNGDDDRYLFPVFKKTDIVIIGLHNNTNIIMDNINGTKGDWSGTLNRGEYVVVNVGANEDNDEHGRGDGENNDEKHIQIINITASEPISVVILGDEEDESGAEYFGVDNPSGIGTEYYAYVEDGVDVLALSLGNESTVDFAGSNITLNFGQYALLQASEEGVIHIKGSKKLILYTLAFEEEEEEEEIHFLQPIMPITRDVFGNKHYAKYVVLHIVNNGNVDLKLVRIVSGGTSKITFIEPELPINIPPGTTAEVSIKVVDGPGSNIVILTIVTPLGDQLYTRVRIS